MNLQFSGKNLLIFGGSCDLSIGLAERAIQAGLFPTLTFRSEQGKKHIAERLSHPGQYDTCRLDFADHNSLNSLLNKLGNRVDFLVDFAQGDFESLIASADENRIYTYFSENIAFRAEFLKKISRVMLQNGKGRMVFISSSAAIKPNHGQGFYAASKLASEALYKNIGLELGGFGVTTITLRPGYINKGRGKTFIQKQAEAILQKVPIKRALNDTEVAETILFLLSESARGFNATEISMDGGLTAGK
jgi:3-oxoacyl-[acyl-carrier protein] reductase